MTRFFNPAQLKPFFRFYGSKYHISHMYPAPKYNTIVEPFAGSAGYSLRHYNRNVFIFDKDPIIVGIWKYLISVTPEEILSLPNIPLDGTVDDVELPCEEAKHLIGFWLQGATRRPKKAPSTWMRESIKHRTTGSFWGPNARQQIADQVSLIRHWHVFEGSYEYIRVPHYPITWFIDPPYNNESGKRYRKYCNSRYIIYPDLADWCQSRKGQVIVCEQEGADWLSFSPLVTSITSGNKMSQEIMYYRE